MQLPFWPEQASEFAAQYDWLLWFVVALTVFFTVLVAVLVVVFATRYRRGTRVDRSRPVHHNTALEIGTISILLVLALMTFAWSARLFANAYDPPDDAMDVFVVGKQWMWHIQHTNGVRENNELHVPAGRTVKLTMISQDVIHSFFIPAFRIKKDVLPGRYTSLWFKPTKPGKYHLFCAEYCGNQHSEMGGWVYVMEPADYQRWLAGGGEPTTTAETGAAQPPASMEAAGQKLYARFACGSCHDPDMKRGPVLAGLYGKKVRLKDGRIVTADDDYLRKSLIQPNEDVSEQWQQIMPSYKDDLTEEQILQLIAYMKSLGTAQRFTTPPATTPPAGSGGRVPTGADSAVPGPNTGAAPQASTSTPGTNSGAPVSPAATTTGTQP